jgi:putative membrane protein|tara:strand:+ start:139 stop:573 length:435 start_codon:yes stop_codon:yes gene_type:complete
MSSYLLFKSLHLISVISWMAGLLYLPRIFVYHVENFEKKETIKIFETMERKLYNYIMRPAMILSWLFGVILIYLNGLESLASLWLQIKLVLVFILTIYHEYLGKCLRNLRDGSDNKSSKFYRIINEIPTILLILTVFVVIFKPL